MRAEHLSVANGYVTCGACDTVFNALASLTEEPPPVLNVDDATAAAPLETTSAAPWLPPTADPGAVSAPASATSPDSNMAAAPPAAASDAAAITPTAAAMASPAAAPMALNDAALRGDSPALTADPANHAPQNLAVPDAPAREAWTRSDSGFDTAPGANVAPPINPADAALQGAVDRAPPPAAAPEHDAGPSMTTSTDVTPDAWTGSDDSAVASVAGDTAATPDAAHPVTTATPPTDIAIAAAVAAADTDLSALDDAAPAQEHPVARANTAAMPELAAGAAPADAAHELDDTIAGTTAPDPKSAQTSAAAEAPGEPPYARTLSAADHAILFTEPGSAEDDVEDGADADDHAASWQRAGATTAGAVSPTAAEDDFEAPVPPPTDTDDEDEHTIPYAVPPVLEAELAALAGQASTPRLATKLWRAAIGVLSVALIAQLVFMGRGAVIEHWPASAAWFERVCAELDCREDPVTRGAVRLIARDIRDHPQYRDALLVNATVVNDADTAVPYPIIELRLHDADGQLLGARRFAPAEYLDHSIAIDAGMPSAQPIYIVMELGGNLAAANSFEFNFL